MSFPSTPLLQTSLIHHEEQQWYLVSNIIELQHLHKYKNKDTLKLVPENRRKASDIVV